MLGTRLVIKRGSRDDGERPFWISFSDLMTALMVLFLLVMSVALLSVTKTVSEKQRLQEERQQDIQQLLSELQLAAKNFQGVTVHADLSNPAIDFGPLARFDLGKSQLTGNQAKFLRGYIPSILAVARTEKGKKWFRQVIVEGYTDQSGTYLRNLDLSLRRSERVVCVLLARAPVDERPLSEDEIVQVRSLFLVGGYSSNSAKADAAASRRIELKLKFWEREFGVGEKLLDTKLEAPAASELGICALGNEG